VAQQSGTLQTPAEAQIAARRPYRSEWSRAWRRFRRYRPALFGLAVIAILIVLALFPGLFAPYDPYEPFPGMRGKGPSWEHPLGMDEIGRDMLSRVIYGSRIALLVGLAATGISLAIGVTVGAAAGFFRGWVDVVLSRVVDTLMAFPTLVLLVALAGSLGPSLRTVVLVIGFTSWAQYARVVRAEVLSLRERDFVLAARALGVPDYRIIFRHLLPNVLGVVIVIASLSIAAVILAESALSFLGLGTQPPQASWGSILSAGRTYIRTYPHICIAPGIVITITVLAFNLLGDGLRDALDPRMKI
jgi:ABC-type dipeptide/oligopeptide/nickel transport system permease subunit